MVCFPRSTWYMGCIPFFFRQRQRPAFKLFFSSCLPGKPNQLLRRSLCFMSQASHPRTFRTLHVERPPCLPLHRCCYCCCHVFLGRKPAHVNEHRRFVDMGIIEHVLRRLCLCVVEGIHLSSQCCAGAALCSCSLITSNPPDAAVAAAFSLLRSVVFAMEYLPGGDLYQRLSDKGTLSLGEAVAWTAQAVLAIEDLHAKSIVHRDVKPGAS